MGFGAIAAAAAPALVGGGMTGFGSAAAYQASKHERNVAWRRQQAWELMAPSLRVEGLRRAGLNPLLAATDVGGPGNVATASVPNPPDFSGMAGEMVSSVRQAMLMKEELANLRKQGTLLEKTAEERDAEARIKNTTADLLSEFGWPMKQRETEIQFETLRNLIAERDATNARRVESLSNAARIDVDRLLTAAGITGAKALEEFYERNPWARVMREFGGGSLVGTAVGGAAAGAAGAAGYLGRRRGQVVKDALGELTPKGQKRRK